MDQGGICLRLDQDIDNFQDECCIGCWFNTPALRNSFGTRRACYKEHVVSEQEYIEIKAELHAKEQQRKKHMERG